MTDCLSLIHHPLPSSIGTWTSTGQMTQVLHTEALSGVGVSTGFLKHDPFVVENTDHRLVAAIVFHEKDGSINSWTDEQLDKMVFTDCGDTVVNLSCWNLQDCKQKEDVCWISDPCARAHELKCCLFKWAKEGKKKSWSFRDSSGDVSFLSEKCLKEMIAEAESECEMMSCRNTRCLTYRCGSGYC